MAKNNKSSNRRTEFSSPNRRKFLIGAGSIAVSGSALLGTAATTTFSLNDRAVSANVVTDSSGAVALTDTEDPGDIVNLTNSTGSLGNGELELDFTQGGAAGVNIGSEVTVGDPNNPTSDPAFTITNQTTDEVDVAIQFKAADDFFTKENTGSQLRFVIDNANSTSGNATSDTLVVGPNLKANGNLITNFTDGGSNGGLPAGSKLDVAIIVNADRAGSTQDDNLSGVLNITATQQP